MLTRIPVLGDDKERAGGRVVLPMSKKGIHIYVAYSRPNGWTEWTEIFVDTHGWPGVFF